MLSGEFRKLVLIGKLWLVYERRKEPIAKIRGKFLSLGAFLLEKLDFCPQKFGRLWWSVWRSRAKVLLSGRSVIFELALNERAVWMALGRIDRKFSRHIEGGLCCLSDMLVKTVS